MSIKSKIKNDYKSINWIIPFISKYRTYGSKKFISESFHIFTSMKVIDSRGSNAERILKLLSNTNLGNPEIDHFYYFIDTSMTVAIDGVMIGNLMLDYSKVVSQGFDYWADKAVEVGGEYGRNARCIKEAVHILHSRILDKLNNNKSEKCLSIFEKILTGSASSFAEALQRILFFNQILWQTRHRLNGLGRLDVILGELYENDIRRNIITKEYAEGLLKEFYRLLHKDYEYKSAALKGDIGQIIILGGLEKDGTYFCNELTKMFLRVQAEMHYPDPKILIRVSTQMDNDLWECIIETLNAGTGSPLISNDDIVIQAMKDSGFEELDCFDYGTSACWEPFVVGKSFDQNNILTVDYWQIFSDFLDSKQNSRVSYQAFEELISDFMCYLERTIKDIASGLDDNKWAEDTFLSLFTDGCSEKGVDISKGGAKYNNYGITTVGLPSLCDSLIEIKKLVFEDGEISLFELNTIKNDNYKNDKRLFYRLKSDRGYFGHTDNEAIEVTNLIIEATNRALISVRNKFQGNVKFGLSAPDYLKKGKKAPADFSGRLKGTPYLTHISSNDSTYPELVMFSSRLDWGQGCINGNVLDFFVAPSLVKENKTKFIDFLKKAVQIGFYQMQMNIMSSAMLIDAKNNPDMYPGLIVRVWGFSSYFNDLSEDYKELLIQRAIENEAVNY